MNVNQLARKIEQQRRKILIYEEQWGRTMGTKALKWVHTNFERESYRDNVEIPWRKLKKANKAYKKLQSIKKKLRNSVKLQPLSKAFKIYTRCKYAAVHNDGFKGTVSVRAHQRRNRLMGNIGVGDNQFSFGAAFSLRTRKRIKDKKVFDTTQVKAHSRNMHIPRRQFMPSAKRGSKILVDDIKMQTEKDILKILKTIR